jgi:hypothetical protein
MERARTRAEVQRRGPCSRPIAHRDIEESSELSTPPGSQPEQEPHREEPETRDSRTAGPHSRQQNGNETGRDIQRESGP